MPEGGGRGKPHAAQPKKCAQCPGAAGGTGSCTPGGGSARAAPLPWCWYVTRKVLGKSPASHPLLGAGNSSNPTSCGTVFSASSHPLGKKKKGGASFIPMPKPTFPNATHDSLPGHPQGWQPGQARPEEEKFVPAATTASPGAQLPAQPPPPPPPSSRSTSGDRGSDAQPWGTQAITPGAASQHRPDTRSV